MYLQHGTCIVLAMSAEPGSLRKLSDSNLFKKKEQNLFRLAVL